MLDENSLAADWRAEVAYCREHGIEPEPMVSLAVEISDKLELPDDLLLEPAVRAAAAMLASLDDPSLDDPEVRAYARQIALAAGSGKLAPIGFYALPD